jgi:putative hydrolase of HD superfamily
MPPDRLNRQIRFLLEIDRLKTVMRRSLLIGGQRRENTAEHSWHLAMMALLLAEHASVRLDEGHVIKLVLVHDLVEIDAGDTYAYDVAGGSDRAEREAKAARRLFGLLPEDQATELQSLWEEFEACTTPEARFANALDRLMPLLHNYHTGGLSWQQHGVRRAQVEERCAIIAEGSTALGQLAKEIIRLAVEKGYLAG